MKRFAVALLKLIIAFLVIASLLFSSILLTAYILTPYLNKKKAQIERGISIALKKPVQISNFSIEWRRFIPIIDLKDLTIWNDSHTQKLFNIAQVELAINLLSTGLSRHLQLAAIKTKGISLTLHQQKKGKLSIKDLDIFSEFSNQSQKNSDSMTHNLLSKEILAIPQVILEDVSINFFTTNNQQLPLINANVSLTNSRDQHFLRSRIFYREFPWVQVDLIANLKKDLSDNSFLTGEMYVKGRNLDLSTLSNFMLPPNYQVEKGWINFQTWITIQAGNVPFVQIRGKISDLKLITRQTNNFKFDNFTFQASWAPNPADWALDLNIENFGCIPFKTLPGIAGLNLNIHAQKNQGTFFAKSENLWFNFNSLFKIPLKFTNFISKFSWKENENKWIIQVEKIQADNFLVQLKAQLGLFITPQFHLPDLNLILSYHLLIPPQLDNYLPINFINPHVRLWLAQAVKEGEVNGILLFRGNIAAFPFNKNEGIFTSANEIKTATLQIWPGWPLLKKIVGFLLFSDRKINSTIQEAEINSIPLKDIQVMVGPFEKASQILLKIKAPVISTTLEKARDFLSNSPLNKIASTLFKNVIATGPLLTGISLSIPLESGKEKFKINGNINTSNANVNFFTDNLDFAALKAKINFTEKGIQNSWLKGFLGSDPFEIVTNEHVKNLLKLSYRKENYYITPKKHGWLFNFHQVLAAGSLFVPNDISQGIKGKLDYIHWKRSNYLHPLNMPLSFDLTDLPTLEISIGDVQYDDKKFGSVQLKITSLPDFIKLNQLEIQNSGYSLVAQGNWNKKMSISMNELIGKIYFFDLQKACLNLGLPSSLEGKTGVVNFRLSNINILKPFNLVQLKASFNLNLQKGRILDVGKATEKNINLGRFLNILSLESLGKRLTFDFSDFTKKGFDYTLIKGTVMLENASLTTNDVVIEGPVALITAKGKVMLLTHQLDLHIAVTPNFTSSVPVIIALLGGPVAGLAAWATNSLVGSQVQKVATVTYHVTGTWDKSLVVKE